jgi:hypothetical protein
MGNQRPRPRAVPLLAIESTVDRLGTAPIGDPDVDAALKTIGRSIDALSAPAQVAASHPTLRDIVVATRLSNGSNWIDHGLGRKPRLVYVTLLDLPISWVTWCWEQQDGDLDRSRVNVVLLSDPAAAPHASVGGEFGGTALVTGEVDLAAIVRVE